MKASEIQSMSAKDRDNFGKFVTGHSRMNVPSGNEHPFWKGEGASYLCKHKYIYYHYGKADHCEECHCLDAKRYEWANISGKYSRERSDWKQLCSKCHSKLDYTEDRKNNVRKALEKRRNDGNWNFVEIAQIDLSSNKVIGTYYSVADASRKLNIKRAAISNVLGKRSKKAGGFGWIRTKEKSNE